ncbi:MAG TPA: hypothetical protein VMG62_06930, partial [Solirubrobacteraceae bacterium]|nr:hypothetical protein [Solirubrobacteraceae bacterium]
MIIPISTNTTIAICIQIHVGDKAPTAYAHRARVRKPTGADGGWTGHGTTDRPGGTGGSMQRPAQVAPPQKGDTILWSMLG